ncbi:MAG: hypothetical protein WBG64_16285 [Thermoanaerobaculia bacterium]
MSKWDIALAAATALLALGEFVALWVARRRGLTRNVSRLVTHGFIGLLMIVYAWLALGWLQTYQSMGETRDFTLSPTINWNYVILGWALALLISFEIVAHLRAIKDGMTRNVSRLATRLVMLILMLIMLSITLQKWDLFLDEYEASYRTSIPTAAPRSP